ncbi:karyopherin [Lithohypha guttulata]|uniref:karyopherin n=1 Tax=Lithohypha guttulata TaxID=1690604 RepID=UPI002DDE7A16|nr:karyopherin [Lithohypha guttulata]
MALLNGADGHNGSSGSKLDLSTVIQALDVIHNPASKNDHRHSATAYLESLKDQDGIAETGFILANDNSQQPVVRYFGLDVLEHVIKRQSFALNEQGSANLRDLILRLSLTIDSTPQPFIRNKIAALWVELAKRSWALDWFDLDEILQQLWLQSDVSKEFVLHVLENLSEDVFVREDPTAILRDRDLNNAVVEIFTSPANYAGGLVIGDTKHHMRCGAEGWTTRISSFLQALLSRRTATKESQRLCGAVLVTLRSVFSWIMSPAIVSANAMSAVCEAMTHPDTHIRLAAIDTLLAFYSRKSLEAVEVQALVHPLCLPASVGVLEQVYKTAIVGPDESFDPRYAISKKLGELMYHLATGLASMSPPEDVDLVPYLTLLVAVAEHDSLLVSIAAIHAWHRLLEAWTNRSRSSALEPCIQPILQVAMRRIIAYDMLPEDEPAVQFVNEEIELYPEKQGFYLNYRRLCSAVIESISAAYLQDALGFVLSSVDAGLGEVIAADRTEELNQYQRLSISMLRTDALLSVIDANFKGIFKFNSTRVNEEKQEDRQLRDQLLQQCKQWATNMLSRYKFRDPGTTLRQIKTAVEASSKLLKMDTEFAFSVLQHILSSLDTPQTNNPILADSYAELHQYAIQELRRLCSDHATYFITFYDQLENNLGQIMNSNLDQKFQIDLKAILMLLVEHASGVDRNIRLERLRSFVNPLISAWSQQEAAMSTFESFIRAQAFDRVGPFMTRVNAKNLHDWTTVTLDEEGQQIQRAMKDGASPLPLRETRVLLNAPEDLHDIVCEVWAPLLRPIIQGVLRLASYNHQLHDPAAWPNLSPDQRSIMQRLMRDRYWQSGISGGSMQEFHHKVRATKMTLEGFASSVRGRIRTNLENCYSIIHTLGRLGSHFYGIPELPDTLSAALLSSSAPLSPHHFGQLLSMLPKLIEECPPSNMQHFLTPVLAELTLQIDRKCTSEWQKVHAKTAGEAQQQVNGDLSDEMRDESVLRQMTTKAVNIVTSWIDGNREVKLSTAKRVVNRADTSFRNFVLGNRTILEPLLMFCTHSIGYKDTKTSSTIIPVLQKFVPAFSTEVHLSGSDAAAVREFISTEMLKAAINSLNDGYFADYHQHLAVLIALIWLSYGLPAHIAATETQPAHHRPPWTDTPQNVLLSIPGVDRVQVDRTGMQLAVLGLAGKQRTMRALILKLLENVRGVRMSELGKIDNKQERSSLLEKYKQRNLLGMQAAVDAERANLKDGVDLEGVADMFG